MLPIIISAIESDGDTTIEPCTVLFKSTSLDQTISYQRSYCDIHPGTEPYINQNKIAFWNTQVTN